MCPKKIVWKEIKESNDLIHKENQVVKLKFLDNGIIDDIELDDKIIEKYVFKVLDLNTGKEMSYSTLSKRLLLRLMDFEPLIDKSFTILKKRIGNTKYDIDFDVNEV